VKLASPVRHDLWIVRRRGKVVAARTTRIVAEVIDTIKVLTERLNDAGPRQSFADQALRAAATSPSSQSW